MKTLFLLVTVSASALALAPHSDENERLNKLLDDRVKANREILKENLAIYDDVDDSQEWKRVEKESNAALIELLEYCRKSEDNKLKRMMLKNEYYMELIYSLSEKDVAVENKSLGEGDPAENDAAIKVAEKMIARYRKKILELGDAIQ
jgi:hypothetical protein